MPTHIGTLTKIQTLEERLPDGTPLSQAYLANGKSRSEVRLYGELSADYIGRMIKIEHNVTKDGTTQRIYAGTTLVGMYTVGK